MFFVADLNFGYTLQTTRIPQAENGCASIDTHGGGGEGWRCGMKLQRTSPHTPGKFSQSCFIKNAKKAKIRTP